jgi:hypothetical protein
MQEAAICLMDCVRLWDPNRGTKFITFLYHSVMTRVGRWVYRNRLVRYPYKKWQEANAVSVLSIYEDGKPIDYWLTLVGKIKDKKHMEIVALLKSDHGLGHGHANAIVAHVMASKDK